MTRIQELVDQITKANIAYRNSDEIITDSMYDALLEELEELDPDNELFSNIGGETMDETRKEKHNIPMFSMTKVKTIEKIEKWAKSKGIPMNTLCVLSSKLDGASLTVNEKMNKSLSRGDGEYGQNCDSHLKLINRKQITVTPNVFTYGELIMSRDKFIKNYSEDYANPRNLAAGQINHKTPTEILTDCDYISYGLVGMDFDTKSEELEFLNENQQTKIDFKLSRLSDLTEENLKELFMEWNTTYEIDGIIIEVNDSN